MNSKLVHSAPGPAGRVLVAVLAMCLFVPAATAQSQIRVQSVRPVGSLRVRPGQWSQLELTAVNRSDQDRDVIATCRVDLDRQGPVEFSREFHLPARSTVRVRLLAQPALAPDGGGANPVLPMTVTCRDARTQRVLFTDAEQQLIGLNERERLILIVDADLDATWQQQLVDPARALLPPAALSRATGLPDTPAGYSGVDLVVLGRADLGAHIPAEVEALIQWVVDGGTLLILGGETTETLLTGRLGHAAGAAVIDRYHTTTLRLDEAAVTLAEPTPVLLLDDANALAVMTADGVPLLTRRRLGLGSVFVSALPGDALIVPEVSDAWQQIGLCLRRNQPFSRERFSAEAPRALSQISGQAGLGRDSVLLLLGGYALLVILGGAWAVYRRRGDRLYPLAVPAAVALAIAVTLVALSRRDAPAGRYVAMTVFDERSLPAGRQCFSYYSPTALSLSITPGGRGGWVLLLPGQRGAGSPALPAEMTNQLILPTVEAPPDRPVAFAAAAIPAGVEPLAMDLRFGPEGLAGTVVNRHPYDLRDAILLVRGRAYGIGRLPAGSATVIAVGLDQRLSAGQFIPADILSPEDRLRNALLADLVALAAGDVFARPDDQPMLLSWTDSPPLHPWPDENLAVEGFAMRLQPVRIGPPARGQRVRVPPEFVTMEFVPGGTVFRNLRGEFVEMPVPGRAEILVHPPAAVGLLGGPRLTVRLAGRFPGYRLQIHNAAGQALAEYDNLIGQRELTIAADDLSARPDGAIPLEFVIAPADITKPSGESWRFDTIDMILEGTTP